MHVRFSTAIGLPVVDEEMVEQLGTIAGIFLHPDLGKVEGFFVRINGFFRHEMLFLSSLDILRWGLRVVVRDADVIAPLEERVRLQALAEEGRPVLSQKILTDTGRSLGRCADVQFDTRSFMAEWIWPRRLWRWGTPFPLSQIIEVRKDAIIVRDPALPVAEKAGPAPILERMPDAA
jgi:uncharacterized protein YrrD